MAKKLVRQFKTHNAPAGARGYQTQATTINPAKHAPTITIQKKPITNAEGMVAVSVTPKWPMPVSQTPVIAEVPRAMGTPALPPDWYPETPNRIWTPDAGSGTRRNTGAEDIPATVPSVDLTTNTTLPPQKPTLPYGQPTLPTVDITPEQFTLPPQQQQIIHERPSTIDYGPITTPIERPTPVDISNIEPIDPYDLTPGSQVVATETSSFNPQPVESAYAAPIQIDYPQTQDSIIDTTTPLELPRPGAHYGDLRPELGLGFDDTWSTPDEVTDLIDTVLPKTIDIHQEGPLWVEDPQAAAAQDFLDQGGFTQTDPTIYPHQPADQIVDESPEITYQGNLVDWDEYDQSQQEGSQQEDSGVTKPYQGLQTDWNAYEPTAQPPLTLPPEMAAPEMPTVEIDTTDTTDTGSQDIWFREGDTDGNQSGSGNTEWTPDTKVADTGVQPGITRERLVGDTGDGTPKGLGPIITDQGLIVERPVRSSAEWIPEPDSFVADDKDEFKGQAVTADVAGEVDTGEVDTSYPGADIPLPTYDRGVPPEREEVVTGVDTGVDKVEDEGGRGTITVQEPSGDVQGQVDLGQLSHRKPSPGAQDVQQKALTTTGTGGRKWVHTGSGDFAETLGHYKKNRGSAGPPIVTHAPAVSGPVVNRETGEITEEPLTWYQFNPAGSSESVYDKKINTGTTGTTGKVEVGTKTEPAPSHKGLQKNNWDNGEKVSNAAQSFMDEVARHDIPIVRVDAFGNQHVDLSSSTWSTAHDAGVDVDKLSKLNYTDKDGNTRNVFEWGANAAGKLLKGAFNLINGIDDDSTKALKEQMGEKEAASFGDKLKSLVREYTLPFETEETDVTGMRGLTGKVQTKGDLQWGAIVNILTGNVPALVGQLGLQLSNTLFSNIKDGLSNFVGSDAIQGVTDGVMNTFKFMGKKLGQFAGLDTFNKKAESKDFETQEMQDWEQTYGEATKGKKEVIGSIEGALSNKDKTALVGGNYQTTEGNTFDIGDGLTVSFINSTGETIENDFGGLLASGDLTGIKGKGNDLTFVVFTNSKNQVINSEGINWPEGKTGVPYADDSGNAWVKVDAGDGTKVSHQLTHGPDKTPVIVNSFDENGPKGLVTVGKRVQGVNMSGDTFSYPNTVEGRYKAQTASRSRTNNMPGGDHRTKAWDTSINMKNHPNYKPTGRTASGVVRGIFNWFDSNDPEKKKLDKHKTPIGG